ncbi:MAG: hypothetical protein R3F24_03925 [Gammaproteobacteria bacterium]
MKWLGRMLIGLAGGIALIWFAVVVYAYWPTGVQEVPAANLAGPADRFVRVDGLDLRYRTWGQPGPDKPTALLLHGFANSLQSFRLLAPLLTDRYYVVACDMPGFGLSDKPAPLTTAISIRQKLQPTSLNLWTCTAWSWADIHWRRDCVTRSLAVAGRDWSCSHESGDHHHRRAANSEIPGVSVPAPSGQTVR